MCLPIIYPVLYCMEGHKTRTKRRVRVFFFASCPGEHIDQDLVKGGAALCMEGELNLWLPSGNLT